MNYCGFNIEPLCSDVCGDHRRPQTLAEICRNMCICCGFRAVAARDKYPGFILLVDTLQWRHMSSVVSHITGNSTIHNRLFRRTSKLRIVYNLSWSSRIMGFCTLLHSIVTRYLWIIWYTYKINQICLSVQYWGLHIGPAGPLYWTPDSSSILTMFFS